MAQGAFRANLANMLDFAFAARGSICAEAQDAKAGTAGSQFILAGFASRVGRELAARNRGPAPAGGAGGAFTREASPSAEDRQQPMSRRQGLREDLRLPIWTFAVPVLARPR